MNIEARDGDAHRGALKQDFAVEVSEHLRADFTLLREACLFTSGDAQKRKFTEKTVDKFSQHIVCRHYSGLCYELTHLCWAIINTGSNASLLDYFYIHENIKPERFTSHFTQVNECQIPQASVRLNAQEAGADFLDITIHNHQFSLSASRINLLATCLEWLLNFVPKLLETLYEGLNGKSYNAIQSMASDLQKQIYHYLHDHLPPAKVQAKFHLMSQYLSTQSLPQFDDEHILLFWLKAREREGMSRFSTVVRDIFQYHQALASAQNANAMLHANDISEHLESETVFSALEAFADEQINLHILTEVPKLLSKQQAEKLQLIADHPKQSENFPLSLMRYVVFGQYQAKCIQAQRNQVLSIDSFALPPLNEYAALLQTFTAQVKLVEQTWMAVLHILFLEDSDDALALLSAKSNFLDILSNEKVNSYDRNKKDLLTLINESEVFKGFKAQCKQAYARNNRQGFTASSQLSDLTLYSDNTLLLLGLSKTLERILHKNEAFFTNLSSDDAKYRSDGCIFKDELMQRMKL
jgi:hypothetical protein